MEHAAAIRPMKADDLPAVFDLARSLPGWFNDLGLEQISHDVPRQDGAVADVQGEIAGFVTWTVNDDLGEIAWIAVGEDHHRSGIGTRLLAFAEDRLRAAGVTHVQVETLGESVEYEPYDRTRAFYRASGFRDLRSVMTDNPGMPESLTLEKPLDPRPGA